MRKFKLKSDQIEFLKKMYPDNELVQRVLKSEKNGNFEILLGRRCTFSGM